MNRIEAKNDVVSFFSLTERAYIYIYILINIEYTFASSSTHFTKQSTKNTPSDEDEDGRRVEQIEMIPRIYENGNVFDLPLFTIYC